MLEAIKQIQFGLMLQDQMSKPSLEAFELNVYAGNLISPMDARYGLEFFKRATAMVPELGEEAIPGIFSMYTTRAGRHYELHEYDTAIVYYRKAINVASLDSRISQVSANNNLGVFYNDIAEYDSARYYLYKALDMLGDRNNHIVMYCAIQDNLAQLSIHEGKYEPALNTFRYNDSLYFERKNWEKFLTNKIRLMELMDRMDLPGLDGQINQVESFIKQHEIDVVSKDVLKFYKFAGKYFTSKHDFTSSARFHELYIEKADSLDRASSEQLHLLTTSLLNVQKASFQNELKAQQLQAEKTHLQLISTRRILFISMVSGAAIVLLLVLYFRMRRQELNAQRKVAESALKQKAMEAKLMEQELVLKKRDLTNLVLHNTQVYDSNQKMIDRLHHIAKHKNEIETEVRSLLNELQSQNQVSERSIGLQERIEEVNEAFYDRLKTKFPNLTKAETELCGFIRINLSSKDISILKNVEASSVKMGKNRLRKKLGVSPEEDLYELIRQF